MPNDTRIEKLERELADLRRRQEISDRARVDSQRISRDEWPEYIDRYGEFDIGRYQILRRL